MSLPSTTKKKKKSNSVKISEQKVLQSNRGLESD